MKQLDYLKKQMKYLTDKNLSLNAKGLLSIILLKDEINLEEIKELCKLLSVFTAFEDLLHIFATGDALHVQMHEVAVYEIENIVLGCVSLPDL